MHFSIVIMSTIMPLKKSKREDTTAGEGLLEPKGAWRLAKAEKRIEELEKENRNLNQSLNNMKNNVQVIFLKF